jgi:hypothetical protein
MLLKLLLLNSDRNNEAHASFYGVSSMSEEIKVGDEVRLKRHVVGAIGVRSVIGVQAIEGRPEVKHYLLEIPNQGLQIVGIEDLEIDS